MGDAHELAREPESVRHEFVVDRLRTEAKGESENVVQRGTAGEPLGVDWDRARFAADI